MLEECFGFKKIGKVFMISEYLYQGGNFFKIVLPLLEEFNNS